ncbi:hypothetical protein Rxycam_01456 [Rubrobacter xylanophilus DSM 9941]|uniref:class I SAM-dependent methyltransferase n=1 Tax=Rubrobacter xylanophilus TaxID=49319 RepID=UPI001C6416F8|nr:methyltransferase domain-containing protein [Rubrobacter xylanophilus]QYJ15631.1 hypothetical protein Rxycam_01456 [Rubrobacter xylanophilus DSM 9941]
MDEILEQNRRSWNAVAEAHASHRRALAGFLRGGGVTLFPEERELLGDLRGLRVAHLMCSAGGDTLSLVNLGARATGVDMSDRAIELARELSRKTGLQARFVRSEVCRWLGTVRERFDVVFCSYGVVCWLRDLDLWARGVAKVLAGGGRFVMVEFHPLADMLDGGWRLRHHYPSGGERVMLEEGVGDYVGESGEGLAPGGYSPGVRGFRNPHPCHLYRWGLGEVITALSGAGLQILTLREYPYVNGERKLPGLRELGDGRLAPPEGVPDVPLMYGLVARRQGWRMR